MRAALHHPLASLQDQGSEHDYAYGQTPAPTPEALTVIVVVFVELVVSITVTVAGGANAGDPATRPMVTAEPVTDALTLALFELTA